MGPSWKELMGKSFYVQGVRLNFVQDVAFLDHYRRKVE